MKNQHIIYDTIIMMNSEQIKQQLGIKAAELVQDGTTIGIGTGSTAKHFILALGERVKEGLNIRGVPTSDISKQLAEESGIRTLDLNDAETIDMAFDGADEVSASFDLIKGGGGAMLQEKMVAFAARHFIVMADESKMVQHLGKFPLPVEVVPYGWKKVKKYIEALGCRQVILRVRNEKVLITEHGHYILDCHFNKIPDPGFLNQQLRSIPGVVESGLFLQMVKDVLVGYFDGTTKLIHIRS